MAQSGDYTYTQSGGNATITGYTGVGGNISIPSTLDTYPVVYIGDSAFDSHTELTSVIIPTSVWSIATYVFYGCTGLTSVTIPNGLGELGEGSFYNCSALTSVTIPGNMDFYALSNYVFQGCSGLTTITIPDNVQAIGNGVFDGCTALTSVTFDGGGGSIGDNAFNQCTALTSVTIPSMTDNIGVGAFGNCSGLTEILVDVDNYYYASVDGVLYDKYITTLIQYPIGNTRTSFTIPVSVTSIGDSAFLGSMVLTDITISNGVTSIGDSTFANCTGLTSIAIPNSVINIKDFAFNSCMSLTNVIIGSGVTTMGGSVFSQCQQLTAAHFLAAAPTKWDSMVFDSCADNFSIYYSINNTVGWSNPFNGYLTQSEGIKIRDIVPRTNNEGRLGTVTKKWHEMFTNKLTIGNTELSVPAFEHNPNLLTDNQSTAETGTDGVNVFGGTLSQDNVTPLSGSYSFKVVADGTGDAGIYVDNPFTDVVPGLEYEMQALIKTSGCQTGRLVYIHIGEFEIPGNLDSEMSESGQSIDAPTVATLYNTSFIPGETIVSIRLAFAIRGATAGEILWVDDIVLRETGGGIANASSGEIVFGNDSRLSDNRVPSTTITTVGDNVFTGYWAGNANTTGSWNVFTGVDAGYANTSGIRNVFTGYSAGMFNTEGNCNVFTGQNAGVQNITGSNNVFIGNETGSGNVTGTYNVFIGDSTGSNLPNYYPNQASSHSVFIGNGIKPKVASGTNEIVIGDSAIGKGNNTVVLGNDNTTDIYLSSDSGANVYAGSLTVAGKLVSAAGLALIDDADAAAQRATLGTAAYSEGTWTPSLTGFTIVGSAPATSGTYKKIGNLVFITCTINAGLAGNTSVAGPAPASVIPNLPFSSNAIGTCTVATGAGASVGVGVISAYNLWPAPFTAQTYRIYISAVYGV